MMMVSAPAKGMVQEKLTGAQTDLKIRLKKS